MASTTFSCDIRFSIIRKCYLKDFLKIFIELFKFFIRNVQVWERRSFKEFFSPGEKGFTRSDHLTKHAKIHERLVPVKRGRKLGSGKLAAAANRAAVKVEPVREVFVGVAVPAADDEDVAETITTEFTIEPDADNPNPFYVVPETLTTTITPGKLSAQSQP